MATENTNITASDAHDIRIILLLSKSYIIATDDGPKRPLSYIQLPPERFAENFRRHITRQVILLIKSPAQDFDKNNVNALIEVRRIRASGLIYERKVENTVTKSYPEFPGRIRHFSVLYIRLVNRYINRDTGLFSF